MLSTTETHTRLPGLAQLLRVLSDPTRMRIVDLLMQGQRCNCELGDTLGLAPNLISHHLGVLRRAGLINARRDTSDARWVYYSMNEVAVGELRSAFDQLLDPARIQYREPQCGTSPSA